MAEWPYTDPSPLTAVLEALRHLGSVVIEPACRQPGRRLDSWLADCPACGYRHGLRVREYELDGPWALTCERCGPVEVLEVLRHRRRVYA